jgi:hypothetical protein
MIEKFTAGFYTALTANAALNTKLVAVVGDKKVYNTLAPQTAELPYLTFGLLTDIPIGTFTHIAAIEDMTFYVNCFSSTSLAHVMQIVDAVKTAMDDASLTITGYTAMKCMREYVGGVIYDTDNKVYQISMRYRVMGSL